MSNLIVTDRKKQLGIILSGSFAGFMAMLDSNIVNISLPHIAKYFNIGTSSVVHVTLVYLLVMASTVIIAGKLADKFGSKKIFITGFVIFTASSLLCGLSPSFRFLLVSRALQATGGAMLISTAITFIPKYIPADVRGWAFGIFSPINSLGILIGNPLGGLITGLLNWHWIFLVNVPIGVIAILFAIRALPADIPDRSGTEIKRKFDFTGSILSIAGLALLVYCLNQGRVRGWTSPFILISLGLSILILILFYIRERKAEDPILDISILKDRNFSLAIIASIAAFGLMAGNSVMMPFYLTYILHISTEHSGFILMTFATVFILLGPVTGRLSDRISKTRMTSSGMVMGMCACLFFWFFIPHENVGFVFCFLVMMGIAYGMFITPNNNLVMSLAKPEKQSISSGVFRLATNFGQMIGVLFMEAMFTLPLPKEVHASAGALKQIPHEILTSGFQYSYLGGMILCLLAFLFSLTIKERAAARENIPESQII